MTKGPLIILSGPSGSGKSTVVARVLAGKEWPLRLSVSATTRSPRQGEIDGVHYHFWPRDQFENAIKAGGFLEWAEVFGNYYGTLRSEIESYREQGTGVLLEIDVQGAAQVRRSCPDAISIFLRTSTLEAYKQRLLARGSETQASLERRLEGARRELERAGEYQYQVINDDLDRAVAEVRAIVDRCFVRG